MKPIFLQWLKENNKKNKVLSAVNRNHWWVTSRVVCTRFLTTPRRAKRFTSTQTRRAQSLMKCVPGLSEPEVTVLVLGLLQGEVKRGAPHVRLAFCRLAWRLASSKAALSVLAWVMLLTPWMRFINCSRRGITYKTSREGKKIGLKKGFLGGEIKTIHALNKGINKKQHM